MSCVRCKVKEAEADLFDLAHPLECFCAECFSEVDMDEFFAGLYAEKKLCCVTFLRGVVLGDRWCSFLVEDCETGKKGSIGGKLWYLDEMCERHGLIGDWNSWRPGGSEEMNAYKDVIREFVVRKIKIGWTGDGHLYPDMIVDEKQVVEMELTLKGLYGCCEDDESDAWYKEYNKYNRDEIEVVFYDGDEENWPLIIQEYYGKNVCE